MREKERVKTIIEAPSLDYLAYYYTDALEDFLSTAPENILNKEQLSNEQYINKIRQNLIDYYSLVEEQFNDIIISYDIGSIEYYNAIQNMLNQVQYTYSDILEDEDYWIPIVKEIDNFTTEYFNQCILYESDILELLNEHDVPDYATINLIRGLQVLCDVDSKYGLRGIYNIYNPNGQIMNTNEASRLRFLTANFNKVVTGDSFWDTIETIKWYIPVHNTMIELPVEETEYWLYKELTPLSENATQDERKEYNRLNDLNNSSILATSAGLVDGGEWFCIERQGIEIGPEREPGDLIPTTLEQIFRIKSYYTQTAINNTVRCEVYKNNKIYAAEITLYFGIHGSNGTDYTITATYQEYKNGEWVPMVTPVFDWHGRPIRLIPHVFNYENIEITQDYNPNAFSAQFYSFPQNSALQITKDVTNSQVSFIIDHNYRIIC